MVDCMICSRRSGISSISARYCSASSLDRMYMLPSMRAQGNPTPIAYAFSSIKRRPGPNASKLGLGVSGGRERAAASGRGAGSGGSARPSEAPGRAAPSRPGRQDGPRSPAARSSRPGPQAPCRAGRCDPSLKIISEAPWKSSKNGPRPPRTPRNGRKHVYSEEPYFQRFS